MISAPGLKRDDVQTPASPYHIVAARKLHEELIEFDRLEAWASAAPMRPAGEKATVTT